MSCPLATTYQFGCCGDAPAMQYSGATTKRGTASASLKLHSPKIKKDDTIYITKKKKRASRKKTRRSPIRRRPRKSPTRRLSKKVRW